MRGVLAFWYLSSNFTTFSFADASKVKNHFVINVGCFAKQANTPVCSIASLEIGGSPFDVATFQSLHSGHHSCLLKLLRHPRELQPLRWSTVPFLQLRAISRRTGTVHEVAGGGKGRSKTCVHHTCWPVSQSINSVRPHGDEAPLVRLLNENKHVVIKYGEKHTLNPHTGHHISSASWGCPGQVQYQPSFVACAAPRRRHQMHIKEVTRWS